MIKLRIWDKQYKRWANPSHFCLDEKGEVTWDSNRMSPQPKSMDEFIVQQFTGLSDKNGKEIYEGDILSFNKEIVEVKWDKYYWSIDILKKIVLEEFVSSHYERVGHIFENK